MGNAQPIIVQSGCGGMLAVVYLSRKGKNRISRNVAMLRYEPYRAGAQMEPAQLGSLKHTATCT